jgi:hypothetical protein
MRCNAAPKRRLIILGSSAAKSYRPEILRAAANAEEVDNLALDYSNVTQIRQLFSDLESCFGHDALRSSTILFITTYILYGDSSRCYPGGYTVYEAEKIRHGLYSGPPNALKPTFGPTLMPWAIEFLRPVFALYIAKYDLSWVELKAEWEWNHLFDGQITFDERRANNLRHLEAWVPEDNDSENFGSEQFHELDSLVSDINRSGARLIFVEEPVEAWLRRRARSYSSYRSRMASFTEQRSIRVIDLSNSARDSEFVDLLHPTNDEMAQWTERLAAELRANADRRLRLFSSDSKPAQLMKGALPKRVPSGSSLVGKDHARDANPPLECIFDSIASHRKQVSFSDRKAAATN